MSLGITILNVIMAGLALYGAYLSYSGDFVRATRYFCLALFASLTARSIERFRYWELQRDYDTIRNLSKKVADKVSATTHGK